MPAPLAPTKSAPTTEKPQIAGVTPQQRAQRAAEERPASEATLSLTPSAADLYSHLGLRTPKATKEAAAETESEEPTEETEPPAGETETEEEPAETEETAGDEEDDSTETEEEEPSTETEEESEETAEEDLTPETRAMRDGMQKRIDRLTAQRSDLQAQLEDLQHQLSTHQAGPAPQGTAENPLAHVHTREELQRVTAEARQVKQWALRNRNGGELPDGKGGTTAYDADEVARMLANAERELDAVPDRGQWLDQQAASLEYGQKYAPNFFTKGTEQHRALEKFWGEAPPAFKALWPDAKIRLMQMLIGGAVLGEQVRKQQGASAGGGTGKKAPQVSAPRVPTAPSGRPATKAPAKQIAAQKATKALRKPGGASERDLASALAARLG